MIPRQAISSSTLSFIFIIAIGALTISSCSARSQPAAILSQAEVAVWEASESRAPQHAPLELRMAREKLEGAKQALKSENYELARRLAEQALADAQLARARADSQFARQNAEELQKTLDALRIEAERIPLGY